MTNDTPSPDFRELTRDECVAVLERNNVGRIAFSYRDHVDIEPIHYQFAEGWLYGRTAPGTKLRTLAHNRWVAFEVDEIRALFDWESVVVKGALYLLEKNGSQADNFAKAVEVLRHLVPAALDAADPTPDRTVVFRIHTDQITGRAAIPRA
ncbi:MAG: pyridoxamine 5'-phosphate oxidase family protein [Gemmatimonadetes bacterium]|nr:pyridoxamine 5'-phosphate oxidase family protein [Gemmatimonadota bacterium]MBI3568955.1 pyridoxamine 5'-phosphate oxidase family protein [Gemmatimonadota bacterium]